MTKNKPRKGKESPLVATAIVENRKTVLITPQAKYYLEDGGLYRMEAVDDYAKAVKKELDEINVVEAGIGILRNRDITIEIRYSWE